MSFNYDNASYFFVELNIRRIESDKRAGISKQFYQTKSPVMVVKICKRIPWGKTQHILRIVRRSEPPPPLESTQRLDRNFTHEFDVSFDKKGLNFKHSLYLYVYKFIQTSIIFPLV